MIRCAEKWIAFAGASALLIAASQAQGQAPGTASTLTIAFKLDSRMSGPTYGGARWVTPPTFTAPGAANICTADARAEIHGKTLKAQWTPADSEMVTLSPSQKDDEVEITVHRAGESSVEVSAQNMVRKVLIKAENKGNAFSCSFTPAASTSPTSERQTAAASAIEAGLSVNPSKAVAGSRSFKSEQEKQSYALGMKVATDLRNNAFDVDEASFNEGFKDALSGGNTLLSAEGMQATISALRNKMRRDQQAKISSMKSDAAETNRKAEKEFLAKNQKQEGVSTLPSGLQYKVLKTGGGLKPTLKDKVICNYRGTFLDGAEFDSSYKRQSPSLLAVANVIPGWKEALQLMPVGSKWQIFVPSELAYGERGTRRRPGKKGAAPTQLIGPNAMLIFEVELLSIEDATTAGTQRAQQNEDATQPGASKAETNQ